ncbi:DivIVA domain-containing protein [Clostridium aestuarii]|uniref:DivIVA domain-containing protein n=1 Tax=Clostridium aestuarii TaxID=338193 RepID=A0ABT4CXK6_9CLOT|nr:DivIVA domain-containing protein [Clostridium aestuarii]MCY6483726.1 DivIVA domain-containing protein [Clostridium aestuarii]
MIITSMDINNKEFKKTLRGYDCDEVDEFLDKISEDYEKLYKENSTSKEKMEMLEEKIKHYSKIENTIQNTLLLAQNAADQAKQSAQNEADLIIKKASDSAQKIIDKAHNDVIKINDEYEALKQEFLKFRAKYKNFVNAQLDTFNSLESEFIKNFNIGEVVNTNTTELPKVTHPKAKEIEAPIGTTQEFNENDLDAIKSFFAKQD